MPVGISSSTTAEEIGGVCTVPAHAIRQQSATTPGVSAPSVVKQYNFAILELSFHRLLTLLSGCKFGSKGKEATARVRVSLEPVAQCDERPANHQKTKR